MRSPLKNKSIAIAMLALLGVAAVMPADAEARRCRTRGYRTAVVAGPYVGVRVAPRAYYYPSVRVRTPRAGVYIGF